MTNRGVNIIGRKTKNTAIARQNYEDALCDI